MELEKQIKNDVSVFYLKGEIDLYKAPEIKAALLKEIEENDLKKVVVNLNDVIYLDSSGIGALIVVITKIRATGAMRLCNIKEPIFNVLKLTGLVNFFQIDNTEEESLQKINE